MLDPLPPHSWNYETAAHLLSRAGFGGTPDEVEAARKEGLVGSVHRLVNQTGNAANLTAPAWAHPENIQQKRMENRAAKQEGGGEAKNKMKQFRQMQGEHLLDLRRWWLERMMTTPAPLLEKMTLFWHGHFATSAEKVQNGYWMWLQNDTLRSHALGNFVSLTKAISRDPAMMIYLDLQQSRKEHPNENWARELMELFTVGIGNYSEADIRESARAFTGYRVDMTNQQFWVAPRQHDDGTKTFMGKAGAWNGDDIIDMLMKQPACAEFIARKLWRFFAEDDPSAQIVAAVAARVRSHNYEMRPVLREMFSSAEFYAPGALRSQIKSPVQYLIQTTKLLTTQLPAAPVAQNAMRQMGQILFAPPNVKGWDGGKSWVSTSTLLFRYNFANYLINGDAMRPAADPRRQKGADLGFRRGAVFAEIPRRDPVDVSKIIPAELREKPNELVASLSRRLFGAAAPEKEGETFVRFLEERRADSNDQIVRELLHLMMSTPQFQLA
ncbi:MAG TPA: DUF1800 domain-containing protein [Chthoniobacterales bacterium]|nr:DUF1800 domain-containing protein [Chthoniobacterales bacterium]